MKYAIYQDFGSGRRNFLNFYNAKNVKDLWAYVATTQAWLEDHGFPGTVKACKEGEMEKLGL